MTTLNLNEPAPDFELESTNGSKTKLADFRGKKIVLYFYPKDNTPGCTTESKDFRDAYSKFQALNTIILGISRDSIKSHHKFIENHCLPFPLLADTDEVACQLYDVIKMKNMYGKQVRGIERSTFLIDEKGNLKKEWRKVKVENHVAEVLEAVKMN